MKSSYFTTLLLFFGVQFFSSWVAAPSGARDIVVPADFPTIGGAIRGAEEGDHIVVEEGRYKENLLLNKNILLISRAGYEKTVIEANRADKAVIRVEGVRGAGISGFTVSGSSVAGIQVVGASALEVSGNLLEKNGTGLLLEKTVKSLISKNIARENQDGIYLSASRENRLEKNVARLNANKGIVLYRSDRNILDGNRASSNEWNGITLFFSNNNLVSNNRAVRNTYGLVVSSSEGNELRDNVTMGRIHYILPVMLIYVSIVVYLVERKLFIYYFRRKGSSPVEGRA